MDTTSIILKTDSRGRVRTPPERRAALVAEFERSGLPATKFSALVGVRYQTFATWVQNHRRKREASTGADVAECGEVRFAEVVMAAAPAAQGRPLRVVLPGGASIELAEDVHVPLAAQLIKALA